MLGFLLTLFFYGSFSFAEHIQIDFIDGKEAVIQDFCRTEDPGLHGNCGFNQWKSIVNIYIPESLGNIVMSHLAEAKSKHYYDELSRKDFFHGHFMLHGPDGIYASPSEYFEDISAVMYHSAEYNNRWEREGRAGIPVKNRRPRSFVGWLDGLVQAAVDLLAVAPTTGPYIGAGTIYADQVAKEHPEIVTPSPDGNINPKRFITACKNGECRTCEPFGQFNILKEPTGRFTTAQGEKVELYFRCFTPR